MNASTNCCRKVHRCLGNETTRTVPQETSVVCFKLQKNVIVPSKQYDNTRTLQLEPRHVPLVQLTEKWAVSKNVKSPVETVQTHTRRYRAFIIIISVFYISVQHQ